MNTDRGIPRGFAALHTPAGYPRRWLHKNRDKMKLFSAVLLVFLGSLVVSCTSQRKPPKQPLPKQRFSRSTLPRDVLTAADDFKARRGQNRVGQIEKVLPYLPTSPIIRNKTIDFYDADREPSIMMTKEQCIELLGPPDVIEEHVFMYNLGNGGGSYQELHLMFRNNNLWMYFKDSADETGIPGSSQQGVQR
ncbi:hypothetical protein ACFL01_03095 [Planctomycetota bacterium]